MASKWVQWCPVASSGAQWHPVASSGARKTKVRIWKRSSGSILVAGHCCSGKLNTWTVLQLLSWIYDYHYCSHVTIQPSHFRPRQPSCYCPPTLLAAAVERNDLHKMLLWQWVKIPHPACCCPQIIHDESNTPPTRDTRDSAAGLGKQCSSRRPPPPPL